MGDGTTVDSARSQRQQPQPPPPPPPPQQVQQPSEVVDKATATNEMRGPAGQDLLGTGRKLGEAPPVEPAVATGADLDAVYRDAGATPPARAQEAGETPAERDGQPRTAADALLGAEDQRGAVEAMARRAGVDISGGTGRMSQATITRRADQISWNLQNGQQTMGPNGPIDVPMSAAERDAINGSDPVARRRAADAVGRRQATKEAFERAVGGPENASRIEQAYQGATSDERFLDAPQIDREANAQRLLQAAEVGSLALGGVGLARAALVRGGRWLAGRLGLGQGARTTATHGAYEVALQGGKHAGFLQQYLGRSAQEIQRGVKSIERQIQLHRDKIANPEAHIPNWRQLDPRQQQALITQKWPSDIARQQEQLDILRGLLRSR